MKQFVTLLIFILCSSIKMNAQTYLDHLKQKNPGQGVVTVHQSKAIDELVNGKQVPTNTNQVNPQDDKTKTTPQPQKKPTDTQQKEVKKIDFAVVLPGEIGHSNYSHSEAAHMKTFLDFLMIANANKIYLARTSQMFKSGFARKASMVNNVQFEEFLIK